MGEVLLTGLKIGLCIIAGNILLAIACGTIFGAYFNCKKKYMKELNSFDKTDDT